MRLFGIDGMMRWIERKGPSLVIVLGRAGVVGRGARHRDVDRQRHREADGPAGQGRALRRHRMLAGIDASRLPAERAPSDVVRPLPNGADLRLPVGSR